MGIEELDRMPPHVREKYLEIVRGVPPARKFKQAFELTDMARGLAAAGIRASEPGIGDEEVRMEIIKRRLPRELFEKVYGPWTKTQQ